MKLRSGALRLNYCRVELRIIITWISLDQKFLVQVIVYVIFSPLFVKKKKKKKKTIENKLFNLEQQKIFSVE